MIRIAWIGIVCLLFVSCTFHPVGRKFIQIDVWYGDAQSFGRPGHPQRWINILGNVSGMENITATYAIINKRDTLQLSLGQDCCRLARDGDFNIDIPRKLLFVGKNRVDIIVQDRENNVIIRKVKLSYHDGHTWPLPYEIRWADVESIQHVADIMDGKWTLTPHGVRTVEPYYDRILTFGDSSWTDYEIQTTIIFHDFTPPTPGPPTYNVSHAAIALRFPGHDKDDFQPHRKWYPLGATGEFCLRAPLDSCHWRIFDGENFHVDNRKSGKIRAIDLNTVYGMKHRVETLTDERTRYSAKLWLMGEAEPEEWDITATEPPGDYFGGAALLIAHNTDVTFGDVSAIPLP